MGKVIDPSNGAAEILHENSTPEPTVTEDNHEVEIIEFRKTVAEGGRESQGRRCCELCKEELGAGRQGCRGEGVVGCVDSCGGEVQVRVEGGGVICSRTELLVSSPVSPTASKEGGKSIKTSST